MGMEVSIILNHVEGQDKGTIIRMWTANIGQGHLACLLKENPLNLYSRKGAHCHRKEKLQKLTREVRVHYTG